MQLLVMSKLTLRAVATVIIVTHLADASRKGGGLRVRRDGISRPSSVVPAITTTAMVESNEVVVPLQRLHVRNVDGMTVHSDATFYVGNITVGHPPQELQVIFDTGSGHVLLPHQACKAKVCLEHHRYSPWASSTSVDVNEDGEAVQTGHRLAKGLVNRSFASLEFTQADLGEGVAKGVLVRDHVCLSSGSIGHRGNQACTDLSMLAATDEDAMPFAAMPADGIIGLGLEGLAVSALSSFYARLLDSSHKILPEFGISLGPEDGKIIFGGRPAIESFAAPLEWFPIIHPEDGLWQVEILSVRVGGKVVDPCSGYCHAIVDTGSSRLGVQGTNKLSSLRRALATSTTNGDCQGPDIEFELSRGVILTLSAQDYTNNRCKTQVGPLNLDGPKFKGVYSFGTNVLRRYYTAFDWAGAKLGFAPNAGGESLRVRSGKSSQEPSKSKELYVF